MIMLFSDGTVGCGAGEICGFTPETAMEVYLKNRKHLFQAANTEQPFLSYAVMTSSALITAVSNVLLTQYA
jgi:hypothetical protein